MIRNGASIGGGGTWPPPLPVFLKASAALFLSISILLFVILIVSILLPFLTLKAADRRLEEEILGNHWAEKGLFSFLFAITATVLILVVNTNNAILLFLLTLISFIVAALMGVKFIRWFIRYRIKEGAFEAARALLKISGPIFESVYDEYDRITITLEDNSIEKEKVRVELDKKHMGITISVPAENYSLERLTKRSSFAALHISGSLPANVVWKKRGERIEVSLPYYLFKKDHSVLLSLYLSRLYFRRAPVNGNANPEKKKPEAIKVPTANLTSR